MSMNLFNHSNTTSSDVMLKHANVYHIKSNDNMSILIQNKLFLGCKHMTT